MRNPLPMASALALPLCSSFLLCYPAKGLCCMRYLTDTPCKPDLKKLSPCLIATIALRQALVAQGLLAHITCIQRLGHVLATSVGICVGVDEFLQYSAQIQYHRSMPCDGIESPMMPCVLVVVWNSMVPVSFAKLLFWSLTS